MTTGCDFRKYQRLKKQVEDEIKTTWDRERYAKLQEIQLKCFPSKEQVIEWIEDFYRENPQ